MLTNDDFRKLLETPSLQQRPAAAATSAAPAAKGENDDNGEKKKRKFYKPKPKSAEKPVSVYRDRAAERRQEKDEDDNEGAPTLSAEQSKFLGGDVQYTHLVRGLDVALLEKTRAEQQALAAKKEILEAFGSDESDEGQGRGNAAANDDVDSLGKRLGALLEGDRVLLKNANTTRVAATLFAPGRMAYMFDLESEADKPTMNMRAVSAHATGTANRRSMASVPVPVIEDVANALAYGSGKKHKKRATATGGAAGGSASAGAATKTMPAGNNSQAGVITLSDVGSKKRAKDEEKIFSDVSSSESEAEEGGDLKKPKIDEEKVKKGSYFAAAGAGSTAQTYDPLRSVLGVSAVKVEAAAKALALKKQAEKKRLDEQLELSKAAAERASAAQGAYGSYLQRIVTVPVEKEQDPEEEAKKSRYIVEEDDEVDDQQILSSYRAALEEILPADEGKKRGAKKPKKKNNQKMKANQEFEKIEKIVAEKKNEKEKE